MINRIKNFASDWAFDLSIESIKDGEIKNFDVINQSIEMILTTLPGERLFNPTFGSNFQLRLFDTMDKDFLELLLNDTVDAITKWEPRIMILDKEVRLNIYSNNNSAMILIPYIVKENRMKAEFKKNITK